MLRTKAGFPGPSPATLRRIEREVQDEVAARRDGVPPPAAPRRRMSAPLTAGLAALAIGGTALAGGLLLSNDDPTVNISDDGRAGLAESPYLRGAPWLFQRGGSPHLLNAPPLRALRFPRGTTYASALLQLTRSVIEEGAIPARSHPVPALPIGAVWHPGTAKAGPRLSLVAPFSYSIPRGRVLAPSLRFPRTMSTEQVLRIGAAIGRGGTPIGRGGASGVRVDAPRLRPCQIVTPGRAYRACRIAPAPAGRGN